VAYGLLHPLRRSLPGQLVVGVAIATLAFLSIGAATDGPAAARPGRAWRDALALGALFGVAGTLALRRAWGAR
jgi:hypothetical protein